MLPDFSIEKALGNGVIGIDEAGRGPLAGPIVAAAIIVDERAFDIGINDSKKLSQVKRAQLYKFLTSNFKYSISIIDVEQIDDINILEATMLAMKNCADSLCVNNNPIIIDGNKSPIIRANVQTIIKGDSKSLTIAAASIIAKETRDKIMLELDSQYPQFKWCKNKGYGTKEHIEALKEYGPSLHHRKTFIKKILS